MLPPFLTYLEQRRLSAVELRVEGVWRKGHIVCGDFSKPDGGFVAPHIAPAVLVQLDDDGSKHSVSCDHPDLRI